MSKTVPNGFFDVIDAPLDQIKAQLVAFQNQVDALMGLHLSISVSGLLTESSDFLLAENGDYLFQE